MRRASSNATLAVADEGLLFVLSRDSALPGTDYGCLAAAPGDAAAAQPNRGRRSAQVREDNTSGGEFGLCQVPSSI